ncbi:MAG: hypothetical protein LBG67_02780 [Campylobacteraceae bacterium]|jgi:hypothetical protein|nr:hypothetical protein [Campylobacteraceae bacterium]
MEIEIILSIIAVVVSVVTLIWSIGWSRYLYINQAKNEYREKLSRVEILILTLVENLTNTNSTTNPTSITGEIRAIIDTNFGFLGEDYEKFLSAYAKIKLDYIEEFLALSSKEFITKTPFKIHQEFTLFRNDFVGKIKNEYKNLTHFKLKK